MAVESWTLKVEMAGERRRLRDWVPAGEEPTFEKAQAAAAQLFELPAPGALTLSYRDDDGDLCTLTEVTLPDALCFAVESRMLHVVATPAPGRLEHLAAHAERVRAGLQTGGARLSAQAALSAEQLRAGLRQGGLRLGASAEQARANWQEGGAGFRARAGQLHEDLCEGGGRLREMIAQRWEEARGTGAEAPAEGAPAASPARVAGAVLAGGAVLIATRNLPMAARVGVFAAGAAGATAVSRAQAQPTPQDEGAEGAAAPEGSGVTAGVAAPEAGGVADPSREDEREQEEGEFCVLSAEMGVEEAQAGAGPGEVAP